MFYKYRVTLAGIKGFFRVYVVNGENSLYTFHKHLRTDLEFPIDQPIVFKGMDASDGVVGKYALFDLGSGSVDKISIDQSVKAGIVKFQYFYDIASKKNVIITLEGECDTPVSEPDIIESKGPVPQEFENGYVAFEDLPVEKRRLPGDRCHCGKDDCDGDCDDEDFDEDEEDEENPDREEEEVIYDENE